ncbi:protein PET117 homolog, mitochondrial isoform X1 [Saccopteryx leptura]|uniref:protein PET117 homolog, mitochondrial isoform X1 n=1 Tax=Saccopteryx leptura TaxID=249018 RepID=UPI00339CCB6E
MAEPHLPRSWGAARLSIARAWRRQAALAKAGVRRSRRRVWLAPVATHAPRRPGPRGGETAWPRGDVEDLEAGAGPVGGADGDHRGWRASEAAAGPAVSKRLMIDHCAPDTTPGAWGLKDKEAQPPETEGFRAGLNVECDGGNEVPGDLSENNMRLRDGVIRDIERQNRKKENIRLLGEQIILTEQLEAEREKAFLAKDLKKHDLK